MADVMLDSTPSPKAFAFDPMTGNNAIVYLEGNLRP